MPERILVILNPAAARGAAGLRAGEISRALAAQGLRCELVRTERPLHATELAAAACGRYDVVVAAGGDGTGNEVLNGLLAGGGASIPALGLLCVGRGNDFAYGAGLPADLEEGCAVLAGGARRPMDVGLLSSPQIGGPRYFGNGIGIGFDTIVTLEAGKMKRFHGFLGYVLGSLKTMFLYYRAPRVAITCSGQSREQKSILISVMNGRRMGGTFYMTPEARNDDGLLDLCIAGEPRRLVMLGIILKYMRGAQASSRHIRFDRAARVEIRALEGELALHADGEVLGTAVRELSVECLPQRILVVSRPQGEARDLRREARDLRREARDLRREARDLRR
jgi:YegS/Rv2252/BmrU family lipid kinase